MTAVAWYRSWTQAATSSHEVAVGYVLLRHMAPCHAALAAKRRALASCGSSLPDSASGAVGACLVRPSPALLRHPHPPRPRRRRPHWPCPGSLPGPCARGVFHTVASVSLMRYLEYQVLRRTYEYLAIVSLMLPDEYSYNFLFVPKMMTATSTEQSTDNSCAFLKRPPFRLRKVLGDDG